MTFLRTSLVVCLLLLVAGCSGTTFVYNRLNIILPWYMGEYVDLNRAQKKELKGLLEPYLEWHRNQELPLYLEVLEDMEAGLDREELTLEDIDATMESFEQAWLRLEARTLEWMLVLGESLSDEQIADFIEVLREQQEEYREEYLERSDEEYREESYESLLDSAEDYLGRLDWGQRAALETAAASLQRLDEPWLQEREKWLDRMERILQRKPGWQEELRLSLAEREDNVLPEYQAIYDNNLEAIKVATIQVLNGRSEKQDKRLRKKLNGLQKDLATLIEQGRKKAA